MSEETPLLWIKVVGDVDDEDFRHVHNNIPDELSQEYDVIVADDNVELLDSQEVLDELSHMVSEDE